MIALALTVGTLVGIVMGVVGTVLRIRYVNREPVFERFGCALRITWRGRVYQAVLTAPNNLVRWYDIARVGGEISWDEQKTLAVHYEYALARELETQRLVTETQKLVDGREDFDKRLYS